MCLCECICGTLGIGDSMNKQKADNLSDVTPWPHFIFREGIFLQLLGKVVSLSHETMHVSSQRFSHSDAQIAMCVWTTRYHVRPCLWHKHLRSNRGGCERIFTLAKTPVFLTERERGIDRFLGKTQIAHFQGLRAWRTRYKRPSAFTHWGPASSLFYDIRSSQQKHKQNVLSIALNKSASYPYMIFLCHAAN